MAMITSGRVSLLLLFLFLGGQANATLLTFQNLCTATIWPATFPGNGSAGGFALAPGASFQLYAPPNFSGRFWGRTGCTFDASGAGRCATGDCGGRLECTSGGTPPATLVEFRTAADPTGMDFYDVSLVDGYNVGMSVHPTGGSGDCRDAGCTSDLNANCPAELRVVDSAGSTVACKSACTAYNTPEFCCTGAHATPQTCPPTTYSASFKSACPMAISYAYDDASSLRTCSGSDYVITFCGK